MAAIPRLGGMRAGVTKAATEAKELAKSAGASLERFQELSKRWNGLLNAVPLKSVRQDAKADLGAFFRREMTPGERREAEQWLAKEARAQGWEWEAIKQSPLRQSVERWMYRTKLYVEDVFEPAGD